LEKNCRRGAPHAKLECVFTVETLHTNDAMTTTSHDGSSIPALIHSLDTLHGTGREKVAHLDPIVRRTEGEFEDHLVLCLREQAITPPSAKVSRCALVGLSEGAVEASNASKSCGEGNLGDWQIGLVQQALGEVQAPRLRNYDGRSSHVLYKQTMQVPRTDPQAGRELIHRSLVKQAFVDEPKRTPHNR